MLRRRGRSRERERGRALDIDAVVCAEERKCALRRCYIGWYMRRMSGGNVRFLFAPSGDFIFGRIVGLYSFFYTSILKVYFIRMLHSVFGRCDA